MNILSFSRIVCKVKHYWDNYQPKSREPTKIDYERDKIGI